MMKKGTIPMRVRRRQSDAKWRASVAKCYDTLKYVIPDCRKQAKRKVSKALILQETEKHIINLEKKLKEVLDIKARTEGKIAVHTSGDRVYPANLDSVRQEYIQIQQTLFMQGGAGRKRYNVPVDVEVSLENLQKEISAISVMTLQEYNNLNKPQTGPTKQTQHPKCQRIGEKETHSAKNRSSRSVHKLQKKQPTKCKVLHLPVSSEGKLTKSIICPIVNRNGKFTAASYFKLDDQIVPLSTLSTGTLSFEKSEDSRQRKSFSLFNDDVPTGVSELDEQCTPRKTPYFNGANMPHTPVSSTRNFTTPSKVAKQLPFSIRQGFTPIKLPTGSIFSRDKSPSQYLGTPQDFQSPEFNFHSPGTYRLDRSILTDDDEDDSRSLLCTESIENMDLDDGWDIEKTPKGNKAERTDQEMSEPHKLCYETPTKKPRKAMKCRKKLEKFYPEKDECMQPVITGVFDKDASTLDFDRYLLFYHHVAEQLKTSALTDTDVAHRVSRMWQNMSEDDRETLLTIASLDRTVSPMSDNSSNLSEDLIDLDVRPLMGKDVQLNFSNAYQVVPELRKLEPETSAAVQLVPSRDDSPWCAGISSGKPMTVTDCSIANDNHFSPGFEDPGFFGDSERDSEGIGMETHDWQSQIVPDLDITFSPEHQVPKLPIEIPSD